MQLDNRTPAVQRLVIELANDFFTESEKRLLQAEVGRSYKMIKFSLAEYALMTQMYPYNFTNLLRTHTLFYKFAMTIDWLVMRLHALYNYIRSLDSIGSTDLYKELKAVCIHPSFIPWTILEDETRTQANQQTFDIRQWNTDDGKRARTLYLFSFDLIRSLVAVSQGLFLLDDTQLGQPANRWCNHGTAVTARRIDTQNIDEDIQRRRPADKDALIQYLAQPGRIINDPNGGAMNSADHTRLGEPYKTVCRRLSRSLMRTQGTASLYATFNGILRELNRVLATTFTKWSLDGSSFLHNIASGPLVGTNVQCPSGAAARFVDHDGNVLSPEQALVRIGDKVYTSGKVDLVKSGCVPSVDVDVDITRAL